MFDIAKRCFIAGRWLVVGVALLLGGCLTVPPHSMSVSDFQKYRIADVRVEGVEVIRSWPGEEEIYVKTNPVDEAMLTRINTEPAYNFPFLRSHFERALAGRFKLEFESQVSPLFNGTRPVRAVVKLKTFDVPSAGRRIFVDTDAKMKAEIHLVDAGNGAPVLVYDGPYRTRRLVGGLATGIALALDRSDTGYSMITDYITAYRNWLLNN